MNSVKIKLFDGFRFMVNEHEYALIPSVKETLALLIVAGGNRVTAKGLWKVLYEYKGIKYNSAFFSERMGDLKSELEILQASDIVYNGLNNVRVCRINTDAVICDYYEMLNERIVFREKKDFLPEFPWADAFYHTNWTELHQHWNSLKC